MNYHKKIVSLEQLKKIVHAAQAKDKVVVQCHGCFDLLHPGHLRHLAWAKQQGNILVVSVSADNVVQKGYTRPYVPQYLRAENLAALEMVDYVTIDTHEWAGPILEELKPDIYVKGKEFQEVHTGRIGRERRIVESYGGQCRFSSGDVVYSSTRIINDLKDRLEPGIEPVHAYCKRHGITIASLEQTINRFQGKRVLVVGDAVVDKYVYCDCLGMSADAPVLVVRPLESETFLGGAGIVAQHVNNLGAAAHFCSVIGKDADGDYVRRELKHRGITTDLVVDPGRPTTNKTRYLSEGKKLLNVNQFRDYDLDTPLAAQMQEHLESVGATADAIVICDFGYGVITRALIESLSTIGKKRGIPVLGDVQCSSQLGNVTRLKGITMATPSEREARLALCDRSSGIADLGALIMAATGNRSLLITLGERGLMLFFTGDKVDGEEIRSLPPHEMKNLLKSEYLPSFAKTVSDPMGAGDAMLAAISCCLAAGTSIMEATYLGNCVAGVKVSKMGNVPVSKSELMAFIREHMKDA